MASTYTNDLRLELIATGEAAATWGDKTNVNLTNIASAFGYATQDGFSANADSTTTVADGVADPARAMYFKVTSSATLTATRTLTIAPNTISRLMWIENATTGGQSIAISQGTGANVTIPTAKTAVVYLDGAGSGAAVVDAMAGVSSGASDTLAEILAAGNTTGGTDLAVSSGDDITFADNSKAIFGAGSDLSVYSDGTTGQVTGNVNVTGSVTASADVTISNGNNRFVASSTSAGDYVRMYGGSGTGKWDIYGNGANLRIGDNESAGLVQIDTDLYTVGSVTSGAHLINAASTAFGSSSVQGFNTDFLVDTGQGYTRHNSYHTGGSNHQFLVNEASSTTNAVAFSIAKDKSATFSGNVNIDKASPLLIFKESAAAKLFIGESSVVGGGGAGFYDFYAVTGLGQRFFTNSLQRMTISSAGNVGINVSSPASRLTLKAGDNSYAGGFRIEGTDETTALAITHVNGDNFFSGNATDDHLVLTGTGNLAIGNSGVASTRLAVTGAVVGANIETTSSNTGHEALIINRQNSDGVAIAINKAGTTVGSWQSRAGLVSTIILDPRADGAGFTGTTNTIEPVDETGTRVDGQISWGSSAHRLNNLYLSGTANIGSIQQTVSSTQLAASIENTNTAGYGMRITTYATGAEYAFAVDSYGGGYSRDFTIGADGNVNVLTGNLTVAGSISKGSGSFKIDHPLPEKSDTHHLVHSFVESPQADNIYRGKVDLVDGSATVNIDDAAGMTEGTYVLLNTNTQCFTSNESGWTAVKGSVSGNILTITAQESCSDTISWLVVGERHDQHMLDTEWTDENGKVIVEPLKESQGDAP